MQDKVMEAFLKKQFEDGMALARASDLLELEPLLALGTPPRLYKATYRCKGLVRLDSGEIVEADEFEAFVFFPDGYPRSVDPRRVVRWSGPMNVWHPNIKPPDICIGHMPPGTELTAILRQIHGIITYNNYMPREDDALNHAACQWARQNKHRLPVDKRPLVGKAHEFRVRMIDREASP